MNADETGVNKEKAKVNRVYMEWQESNRLKQDRRETGTPETSKTGDFAAKSNFFVNIYIIEAILLALISKIYKFYGN
jgi:hypothetical protein